jgi:hypothetical protein
MDSCLEVMCFYISNGGNYSSSGITLGCGTSPRKSTEPRMGENNKDLEENGPKDMLRKESTIEWKLEGHTTREESL